MDFVPIPAPVTPNAPPLGYSCLEDPLRFFQKLDKNDLLSNGIVVDATTDILVQRILEGKPGRRSTTFVSLCNCLRIVIHVTYTSGRWLIACGC